jgi:hypothetical protein
MIKFFPKLQPLVAEISWAKNLVILAPPREKIFFLRYQSVSPQFSAAQRPPTFLTTNHSFLASFVM